MRKRDYLKNRNKKENLNYFCGREKKFLKKYSDYRTKFFLPISKILIKLGVTADLLSYIGLFILIGFIYFIKTNPIAASIFLLLHVAVDAFDGPLAKARNEAGDSGAFTDIICDHTGMIVVVLGLIYAGLADSLLGIAYIYIYTILIFFMVVRNKINNPIKLAFRSKYELYLLFGLYAFLGFNFLNIALSIFILAMIAPLVSSYFVIKNYLKQ